MVLSGGLFQLRWTHADMLLIEPLSKFQSNLNLSFKHFFKKMQLKPLSAKYCPILPRPYSVKTVYFLIHKWSPSSTWLRVAIFCDTSKITKRENIWSSPITFYIHVYRHFFVSIRQVKLSFIKGTHLVKNLNTFCLTHWGRITMVDNSCRHLQMFSLGWKWFQFPTILVPQYLIANKSSLAYQMVWHRRGYLFS